ncbi:GNAT family acetyltransferase [Parvibaculum sedimenti]|uniref:GNAT family acetyltransferase n=1 Tax=Parvibaculum sedimenti TaxID=2608632 RepID=A0A6N6VGU9_9HYPH|nr:GNAT family acetyltransferase [Parvibaculum sedimenti]KAB7739938.1 GNAT family acetyltransferase [Parvibaculum sedimenti]
MTDTAPPTRLESKPGISVRPARDGDVPALVLLWDACGLTRPWNDAPTDIAFARRGPNSDVLVAECEGKLLAAVIVGHDGHRGCVYYVSADPEHRGQGLGRLIMEAAEAWLVNRGVWKLNLQVRKSNLPVIDFYKSLGYGEDETVPLSKRLQPAPHIDPDAPR